MMAFNGFLMSAIGAACHRAGMDLSLWSFVAPHGALELPAIFIAGGAGLLLGRGLLFPGWLSRRESLAAAASTAMRLVLGVIPLLVIAGLARRVRVADADPGRGEIRDRPGDVRRARRLPGCRPVVTSTPITERRDP